MDRKGVKEMIQDAINKINEEMDKYRDNQFVQIIGQYVIKQLEINKESADKIEKGEKTLVGSLNYMQDKARKSMNGKDTLSIRCVVISDEEGFKIVDEYFEFTAKQEKSINLETEFIKRDTGIEDIKPVEVKKTEDNNPFGSNDLLSQLLGE